MIEEKKSSIVATVATIPDEPTKEALLVHSRFLYI